MARVIVYSDGMERQITQHEAWQLPYRSDRYLRDLSNSELFARAGDLMSVALGHSEEGRVGLGPVKDDKSKLERYAHVLEELIIRSIDVRQPEIMQAMHVPEPNSPKVTRALKVLARKSFPTQILTKFGERKYMACLFLEGKGRISLAKTYTNPSLGHARADDESQISVYVHPTDAHRLMEIKHDPNESCGVDVEVPYLGSVQINLQASTDFYVYCMAESCHVRMFDDFTTAKSDVDTCVVVTRPDEFRVRLREAAAAKLPGWKLLDGPVLYVDPFFARIHQLAPHFCKHFRFEYQKEYRFVWLPPSPDHVTEPAPPDHIDFDLGPLTDCADLVWL